MRTRSEHSAGGVVIRRERGGIDVVLAARRTRKGDLAWGLPKGLVERGEEPSQTAIREVEEETGLQAEILEPLGDISYWYVWEDERIKKKVTFFLMQALGGDMSNHDHEMEDVRWFPLDQAKRKASYSSERDVLRRAVAALAEIA
jgi:8-oxo-dGTP pyrophosphatase MutT (NUDIX family)